MTRTRLTATLGMAALVALVATGCTPTVTPPSTSTSTSVAAGPTATATPTPTPTVATSVEPASRYSVGCDTLMPAASFSSLFTHALTATPPGVEERKEAPTDFPSTYFINQLGGLDCAWTDGKTSAQEGEIADLTLLPVDDAGWKNFTDRESSDTPATKYVQCSPAPNDCEYDAYVGGTWITISLQNMTPKPGGNSNVMPGPFKTLVTSVLAALAAAGAHRAPLRRRRSEPLRSRTIPHTS